MYCSLTLQRSHKLKFNRINWLLSRTGKCLDRLISATEPVDRIGTHSLDTDVTMASTPGRCSGGRSSMCWLDTLKSRRQRKGRGINVASLSNVATS